MSAIKKLVVERGLNNKKSPSNIGGAVSYPSRQKITARKSPLVAMDYPHIYPQNCSFPFNDFYPI